ncbi:hypothetical protein DFH05DRAFT_1518820 [Lentinula detonsa]|uniref:Uncharacterized protein n=1 Tax=Lentinula detonsa TaxID=2804962 RepID=A0A9W8PB77_9AGAR|nr:hypothetical protein DFH05DRAFT_1518820 [Lentinula detonsa]
MSSAIPSRSDSSRSWWSLSSKGSPREPSSYPSEKSGRTSSSKRNDSTKFTLTSPFASLKVKKHPSLAIQDPPPPSFSHHPEPLYSPESSPKYTNRPPSKSVSSTRSRVDSIEPRTPLDGPRDPTSNRHSLLTLSDIDPFRSAIAAPHSAIDPNRLSAYSGSSVVPEYITKKFDDVPVAASRISYASSSSRSFSPDDASLSPTSSLYIAEKPSKKLSQKKSLGDLGQKTTRLNLDEFPGIIKSNSSVTLTEKNRLSHPELPSAPRPLMRARGMTDAAATYRVPNFLQADSGSAVISGNFSQSSPLSLLNPPASPRVIIRQPSIQRMGLPISAPPSHRLPPPPVPIDVTDEEDIDPLRFSNSASSSTTSFRSTRAVNLVNQHYIPHPKARERVQSVEDTVHKSRTLKKAASHQSLSKVASSSATSVSTSFPELVPEKGPRKQRSFHHTRIPLPQIPLSLKHQSSGSAVTLFEGSEPKRGSLNGPPTSGRKRLFSGSSMRRPSTSQETFGDDDHRSVFSLDKPTPVSPTSTKLSNTSSFWDEGSVDAAPSSPRASTLDYTPQQIMSPAEMLRLEADVQESMSSSRSRGMSIASASTIASEPDSASPLPSLTGSVRSHGFLNPQPHPTRSNSMGSGGMVVTPRLPRPSTGHSISSPTFLNDRSSPGLVSLPPPPRSRRPQPSSIVPEPPLKALSPPPRPRVVKKTASNEKVNRRPGMTRKSSFLDIDGDVVVKKSSPPSILLHGGESFLNLDRESLDTVRSDTDEEQF